MCFSECLAYQLHSHGLGRAYWHTLLVLNGIQMELLILQRCWMRLKMCVHVSVFGLGPIARELWFHFGYTESLNQTWEATMEQFSVPITPHSSSSDCHVTVILLVGGKCAAEGLHKNFLPIALALREDVFPTVFMEPQLCVLLWG